MRVTERLVIDHTRQLDWEKNWNALGSYNIQPTIFMYVEGHNRASAIVYPADHFYSVD